MPHGCRSITRLWKRTCKAEDLPSPPEFTRPWPSVPRHHCSSSTTEPLPSRWRVWMSTRWEQSQWLIFERQMLRVPPAPDAIRVEEVNDYSCVWNYSMIERADWKTVISFRLLYRPLKKYDRLLYVHPPIKLRCCPSTKVLFWSMFINGWTAMAELKEWEVHLWAENTGKWVERQNVTTNWVDMRTMKFCLN